MRNFAISLVLVSLTALVSAGVNLLTSDGSGKNPELFVVLLGTTASALVLYAAIESRSRAVRRLRGRALAPPANPHFINREAVLTRLRGSLPRGKSRSVSIEVIIGLDGIGKTQLAVQHLTLAASSKRVGFYVDASLLDDQLLFVTERLGFPPSNDSSVAITALEKAKSAWVLVIDGAVDWGSVAGRLPSKGPGQIVLTTANDLWDQGGPGRVHRLTSLKIAESTRYLCRATRESDERSAERLAKALAGFPLALNQAASYINEVNRQSLAGYVSRLRTRAPELFAANRAPDYRQSLHALWLDGYLLTESDRPASALLLLALSWFEPTLEIDLQWFLHSRVLEQLFQNKGADEDSFFLCINSLARLSFVSFNRERESVRVHPLLSEWCREKDKGAEGQRVALRVIVYSLGAGDGARLTQPLHAHSILMRSSTTDVRASGERHNVLLAYLNLAHSSASRKLFQASSDFMIIAATIAIGQSDQWADSQRSTFRDLENKDLIRKAFATLTVAPPLLLTGRDFAEIARSNFHNFEIYVDYGLMVLRRGIPGGPTAALFSLINGDELLERLDENARLYYIAMLNASLDSFLGVLGTLGGGKVVLSAYRRNRPSLDQAQRVQVSEVIEYTNAVRAQSLRGHYDNRYILDLGACLLVFVYQATKTSVLDEIRSLASVCSYLWDDWLVQVDNLALDERGLL